VEPFNINSVSINILIADDHQVLTDGLKSLLAGEEQLEIKGVASNGAEALEMLKLLKVDVVLMDIDMPVMGGIEATRIIKKDFPGVKVLMLTMHDEKAIISMLLEIGADGYVLKNSTRSELLHAIREVAAGRKHLSEEVRAVLLTSTSPGKDSKLGGLTQREVEILQLVAEGLSNKEIGERLFISHRTVDTHRTNLMTKLSVHNVAGLVRFAIENGLVDS